jgi:hypothetical protein
VRVPVATLVQMRMLVTVAVPVPPGDEPAVRMRPSMRMRMFASAVAMPQRPERLIAAYFTVAHR